MNDPRLEIPRDGRRAERSSTSGTGAARSAVGADTAVAAARDAVSVLRSIVEEVDARGPEGHWLARSSLVVAEARLALLNTESGDGKDHQRIEAALRDLVWRIEHVREGLAARPAIAVQDLDGFLNTTDARRALGLPAGSSARRMTGAG